MAFNGFINFGDIKGESTDKDHKDWILIQSFAWKISRPGQGQGLEITGGHGPTTGGLNTDITHKGQGLEITVGHGSGIPLRMKACKGTHIPEVILDTSLRAPGSQLGLGTTGKGTHIPELIYSRSRLLGVVVGEITVGPTADTFTLEFGQKIDGTVLQRPDPKGSG